MSINADDDLRPHTGDDPLIDGVSAAMSALEDVIEELTGVKPSRAAITSVLDLAQGALEDLQAVEDALVRQYVERQKATA